MYERHFKRVLDVAFAVVALLILSPVFVLVALAIVIEAGGKGPALFRQVRSGRHALPFTIFKFRSMPVDTADIPSAEARSLRVTRVGAVIRRTNLDEIPQLYNILRGDMSLVGPRPALPSQVNLLAMRAARGVTAARPGLTGLAQVNGYDGMPDTEKVGWEEKYVRNITFVGDLLIVIRTFGYVLRPPPVY